MNTTSLYIGAAVIFVLGLVFKNDAALPVSLGLMWIGIAVKTHRSR